MIEKWAWKLTDICLPDGGADEREIVAYGLECRISDLVQLVVLTIVALLLGLVAEMLCFCLCFTALKRQAGGCHCATHFACITVFSVVAADASLLAARAEQGWTAAVAVMSMAVLVIVLWKAPIAHPNHPKSSAAHRRSRRSAIVIAAAQLILLPPLTFYRPEPGVAGALGGIAAAITLLIPILERKEREKCKR